MSMSIFTALPVGAAFVSATCIFVGASAAQAATITVSSETGVAMETEFGFRGDTGTRGIDLAGAIVTATFDDGDSETFTWLAFDDFTLGGVNGDRWSLYQEGDADVDIVTDGRVMTTLSIDLSTSQSETLSSSLPPVPVTQGASLFDISAANENNGDLGSTQGSTFGFPFEFISNAPTGDVAVNYSGAVNLVGMPAVGDLFTTMFVDFRGLDGGGFMGSSTYRTDQDTLIQAGDLSPVVMSAVPLPAGLPLLLFGLGGLGLMRRSRSTKTA